jgi:hypothetical protein
MEMMGSIISKHLTRRIDSDGDSSDEENDENAAKIHPVEYLENDSGFYLQFFCKIMIFNNFRFRS